ncbi:MAG: NADH dehydrogenase (quinone) subunit D [Thermodesulfobacteriota bacterium]|nr:NADH dehydrogenase (quinone) subunit D [Thermodesulfobacteriota bacterium]
METASDEIRKETITLNMGPQHPSTHGVLRVMLEMDGEIITKTTPVLGYLHRGIEKIAEHKTYHQFITLTDRLDYTSPFINNLAYVLAVEKLLDLEIPLRAQYIRVMLSEITRIQSHLIWLGTHALDIGAMSPLLYTFREREETLDMFEMVGGARMNQSYFRIGGLAADLPEGFVEKVRAFCEELPSRIEGYERLLTENKIWIARTKDVGVISAEDGIELGLSGPCLRGSGVEWDLRKANPYSSYDHFDFDIPTGKAGDTYDRYLVRMEEMRQSNRIIKQVLDKLPSGEINAYNPKVISPLKEKVQENIESLIIHFHLMTEGFNVPKGEAYASVESSKGELGFYVVSDGTSKPHRIKIRTPSFVNMESLATMVEGSMMSDIVSVIGSIDICLGEVDR